MRSITSSSASSSVLCACDCRTPVAVPAGTKWKESLKLSALRVGSLVSGASTGSELG